MDDRRSRRAVLVAAGAGAAVLTAGALTRPLPAEAASVVLGATNNASALTTFKTVASNVDAVAGDSDSGTGVIGGGSIGVYGTGGYGVFGDVYPTGTGVYGFVGDSSAPLAPAGVGVCARAEKTTQTALSVFGKVKFDRAGKVTIATGATSYAKTLAGVTASSVVLAVLQTNASGVYVRAVVPGSGKFTVYLNKAHTADVKVAWFVIN